MATHQRNAVPSPITERSRELVSLVPVVRRAIQLTRLPPALAGDAEQRALSKLTPYLERLRGLDDRARAAYAFKAATHAAYWVRREHARHSSPGLDVADAADALRDDDSPDCVLLRKERSERLLEAAHRLSADDCEILDLIAHEGLTEREAADRLVISRGSLVHRLRRAREVLRRAWVGTTSRLGTKRR